MASKTYYDGACTEGAKKGPADGSCSFVGHVCEEIDDADDQDKSEGQFCYILFGHLVERAFVEKPYVEG